MSPALPTAAISVRELALSKMARILGGERAHRLMSQILASLDIELRDADDLLMFANELSKLGGFEGAVGAMLSVQAVMHGATGDALPAPSGRSDRT